MIKREKAYFTHLNFMITTSASVKEISDVVINNCTFSQAIYMFVRKLSSFIKVEVILDEIKKGEKMSVMLVQCCKFAC